MLTITADSNEICDLFDGDLRMKLAAGKFSKYSQIYSFTTENLSGYLPQIPLNGARVLAVGGSGDTIVNTIMMGANEVVSFDINVLAGLYTDLKLAALQQLNFEDFKKFLMRQTENGGQNKQALDITVYEGLRSLVTYATAQFFDNAFSYYEGFGAAIRESPLFNNKHDTNLLKILSNPYLQTEKAYQKAKMALAGKKPLWITSTAKSIADKLAGTFDVILLSNLTDYSPPNTFAKEVIAPLSARLKPRGIICAAYVYETEPRAHHSQVDNPEIRRAIFGSLGLSYTERQFESVIPEKKDAVILLGGK